MVNPFLEVVNKNQPKPAQTKPLAPKPAPRLTEIIKAGEQAAVTERRRQAEAPRKAREREKAIARKVRQNMGLGELETIMATVDAALGTNQGDAEREAVKAYLYGAREVNRDKRPLGEIAQEAIMVLRQQGVDYLERGRQSIRAARDLSGGQNLPVGGDPFRRNAAAQMLAQVQGGAFIPQAAEIALSDFDATAGLDPVRKWLASGQTTGPAFQSLVESFTRDAARQQGGIDKLAGMGDAEATFRTWLAFAPVFGDFSETALRATQGGKSIEDIDQNLRAAAAASDFAMGFIPAVATGGGTVAVRGATLGARLGGIAKIAAVDVGLDAPQYARLIMDFNGDVPAAAKAFAESTFGQLGRLSELSDPNVSPFEKVKIATGSIGAFTIGVAGGTAFAKAGKAASSGMGKIFRREPITPKESAAIRTVANGVDAPPAEVARVHADLESIGVDTPTANAAAKIIVAASNKVNQAGEAPTGRSDMPEGMARQMANQGVPPRQEPQSTVNVAEQPSPEVSTTRPVSKTGNIAKTGEPNAPIQETPQTTTQSMLGQEPRPQEQVGLPQASKGTRGKGTQAKAKAQEVAPGVAVDVTKWSDDEVIAAVKNVAPIDRPGHPAWEEYQRRDLRNAGRRAALEAQRQAAQKSKIDNPKSLAEQGRQARAEKSLDNTMVRASDGVVRTLREHADWLVGQGARIEILNTRKYTSGGWQKKQSRLMDELRRLDIFRPEYQKRAAKLRSEIEAGNPRVDVYAAVYDDGSYVELTKAQYDYLKSKPQPQAQEVVSHAPSSITLYHGSPANTFEAPDPSRPFFLSTSESEAKRYSLGKGGNRSRTNATTVLVHDSGQVYRWSEDRKFAIRDRSADLEGEVDYSIKLPDKIPAKDIAGDMWGEGISGGSVRRASLAIPESRVLNASTDNGLRILAGLSSNGNRFARDIIDSIKDSIGRGGMDWYMTKSSFHQDAWMQVIAPQLRALGYDAVKFHEGFDGIKSATPYTYMVLDPSVVKLERPTPLADSAPRTYESLMKEANNLRGLERVAKIKEARALRIEEAARGGRMEGASGLNPADLQEFTSIARGYIEAGVDWVRGLREDYGQEADPYIESIQRKLDEEANQVRQVSQEAPQAGQRRSKGTGSVDRAQKAREGRVPTKGKGRKKEEVVAPEGTRLTHADTKKLREELQFDEYIKRRVSDQELVDRVKSSKAYEDVDSLAEDIIVDPRPVTAAQQLAMDVRADQLVKDWREMSRSFEETGVKPVGMDVTERLLRNLLTASDIAGSEGGRSQRARQFLVNLGVGADPGDFDAMILQLARDKGVPASVILKSGDKKLESVVKKLKEEADQIRKERDVLAEQNKMLQAAKAQAVASEVSKPTSTTKKQVVRDVATIRAEKNKAIADLKAAISKAFTPTGLGSGIGGFDALARNAPEVARQLRKVISLYIEEVKATKLDKPFFDGVRESIGDLELPDGQKVSLTDDEIVAVLAREYDQRNTTQAKLESNVKELEAQARIANIIRKVIAGEPLPTKTKRTPSAEVNALKAALKQLTKVEKDPARLARLNERLAELEAMREGKYRKVRQPKPIEDAQVSEIKSKIASTLKDMRLEDRISDLQEQIRTGNFRQPDPKVEKLTAQQAEQKAKIKRLEARAKALAAQQRGTPLSNWLGRFINFNMLVDPIARLGDLYATGVNIPMKAARQPISTAIFRGVEAWLAPESKKGFSEAWILNPKDMFEGRKQIIDKVRDVWRGVSDEGFNQDKRVGTGTKAAATGDAVISPLLMEPYLRALAKNKAIIELGRGATKAEIKARAEIIRNNPPDEIIEQVNEFALENTFNSANILGEIANFIEGSMSQWGKKMDKKAGGKRQTFENVLGMGGQIIGLPFRFTKVITNVLLDILDHMGVGIVRGGANITGMLISGGYSPEIARKASDQIAKGLVGSAMMTLGYYAKENLFPEDDSEVIKTKNGSIYFNTGYLESMLPGAWQVFAMGRQLRKLQDMRDAKLITDKQYEKASWALFTNNTQLSAPLIEGLGRGVTALNQGEGQTKEWIASQIARGFIPAPIRRAAQIDYGMANQDNLGEFDLNRALQYGYGMDVQSGREAIQRHIPLANRTMQPKSEKILTISPDGKMKWVSRTKVEPKKEDNAKKTPTPTPRELTPQEQRDMEIFNQVYKGNLYAN